MPVVFYIMVNVFLLLPYLPADPQVLQQINEVNTRAVLVITFVAVLLTGLLYNLNIPIVRLYEGYTWENSFIGRWRKARYEKELSGLLELRPRLQDLHNALTRRNQAASIQVKEAMQPQIRALGSIRSEVGRNVNREFPSLASVLPTKLGNVIRSFETYPQKQYNIAAIPMYPRLVAVIDKEYLAQIENAKSAVDFTINCSLLSAVSALSILVAGLVYPLPFGSPALWTLWLIKIAFFVFLSWAFYVSSIGRAHEWGDLVKGAFDLYRWKLLDQLGFERIPKNMEEERVLWEAISAQLIFGDRANARLWEYSGSLSSARGVPPVAQLETMRALSKTDVENVVTVTVVIKNNDTQKRAVKNVKVTEILPEGAHYIWKSAKVARTNGRSTLPPDSKSPINSEVAIWHSIAVTGANPYGFAVGDLDYNDQIFLSYQMLLHKN